MNKEKFLDELLQYEGENCITIETIAEDGEENSCTIEDGGNFIGGTEGTFMSDLLGNIYFDDLDSIACRVYDYITKELKEKIVDVVPY